MKYLYILLFSFFFNKVCYAQADTSIIVSYNLLNYPNASNNAQNIYRESNYKTSLTNMQPDILVAEEVNNPAGGQRFLDSVLKKVNPNYAMGTIINNRINGETENAVFYLATKFTFVSNTPIITDLRDINEFAMVHTNTGIPFSLFAVHLKASNTASDIDRRRLEIDSMRKVTNLKPVGHNSIALGDFNIYTTTESGYQLVLQDQVTNDGEFYDPLTLSGLFNKVAYAPYHTQSSRKDAYSDGGSTGGCNDRFDLILNSQGIANTAGAMDYVPNSLTPYGNDGNHYNDSINSGTNTAVGNVIATALVHSSDHLPIMAKYRFEPSTLALQLIDFTCSYHNNRAVIEFSVANESNISSYEIQYTYDLKTWNTFGNVTSNYSGFYKFSKSINLKNPIYLRLQATNQSGSEMYSAIRKIEPENSIIVQLYPNPTRDEFTLELSDEEAVVELLNSLGSQIFRQNVQSKITQFSLSDLPKGVYFLRVNNTAIQKIVKW